MMMQPTFRRNFPGKGSFPPQFDGSNMGSESDQMYQVRKLLFLFFFLVKSEISFPNLIFWALPSLPLVLMALS